MVTATIQELREQRLLKTGSYMDPQITMSISLNGTGIEKIITFVPTWRVIERGKNVSIVSSPFAEVSFQNFRRNKTMGECKEWLNQVSLEIWGREDNINARCLQLQDIEDNKEFFSYAQMRVWLADLEQKGNLLFASCTRVGKDPLILSSMGYNVTAGLSSVIEVPITAKAIVKNPEIDGNSPQTSIPIYWE